MPKLTLAERMDKAARRKARATQDIARLEKLQKNEQTRRLIELGRLAAKTGIDTLPPAALYACFLRIAKEAADAKMVAAWSRDGGRLLRREAAKDARK